MIISLFISLTMANQQQQDWLNNSLLISPSIFNATDPLWGIKNITSYSDVLWQCRNITDMNTAALCLAFTNMTNATIIANGQSSSGSQNTGSASTGSSNTGIYYGQGQSTGYAQPPLGSSREAPITSQSIHTPVNPSPCNWTSHPSYTIAGLLTTIDNSTILVFAATNLTNYTDFYSIYALALNGGVTGNSSLTDNQTSTTIRQLISQNGGSDSLEGVANITFNHDICTIGKSQLIGSDVTSYLNGGNIGNVSGNLTNLSSGFNSLQNKTWGDSIYYMNGTWSGQPLRVNGSGWIPPIIPPIGVQGQ
eukprot:NODE_342_length_9153_cov_0.637376.p4 type:complete len:307 gc:universal NODE_342_length_9153_cov_0.637376:8012-8932(+)